MHTEHLQNVHPIRVLGGWFVAIAVTSVVVFGFIVLGLMGTEAEGDTVWAVVAVGVGFLVGGWFTGMRTLEAPILHGIALGLASLAVWAALNVAVVIGFGMDEWTGLGATGALLVVLFQMVAGVAGCWMGTQSARLRASEMSDSPAVGVRGRDEE